MRTLLHFFKSLYYLIRDAGFDFIENQDTLKAAALSFYTLTSIVPFLAIMFGVANGLGIEDLLAKQLHEAFSGQEEIIEYVILFARSTLQNTRSSVIAGVGSILLLWTAYSILSNVETTLNDILKVRDARSWSRKFLDYTVLIIVLPIVFIATSSFNVYLATQITASSEQSYWLKLASPYLLLFIKIVPFLLSILLFIIIYVFVPTNWISLSARITAGIITGTFFQIWQLLYIRFQGEISTYGAIYGTFAALPLFLLWLQVSWLIVLAGAEIAAYLENKVEHPDNTKQIAKASPELVGIMIAYLCIKAYNRSESPPTLLQIAQVLGISPLITKQLINILQRNHVLLATEDPDSRQVGFVPNQSTIHLKIKQIADDIARHITWTTPMISSPAAEKIAFHLNNFTRIITNSNANISLSELIQSD